MVGWNREVPIEISSFQEVVIDSFQGVGIEGFHYNYRDVLISGGWNRGVLISGGLYRGDPCH